MRPLTLLTVFFALSLGAQETPAPKAAKKAKAAAPKADAYSAAMPKPTLANVRYGEHERHVLDFWKAESAGNAPSSSSSMAGDGSAAARSAPSASPTSRPC